MQHILFDANNTSPGDAGPRPTSRQWAFQSWWRPCFLFVAASVLTLLLAAAPVQACTVCSSSAGEEVRAGILDGRFIVNLLAVILPFAIIGGIVAILHFGWPRWRRNRD